MSVSMTQGSNLMCSCWLIMQGVFRRTCFEDLSRDLRISTSQIAMFLNVCSAFDPNPRSEILRRFTRQIPRLKP